jgi:Ca2+-binding EF-hand superfamily protein
MLNYREPCFILGRVAMKTKIAIFILLSAVLLLPTSNLSAAGRTVTSVITDEDFNGVVSVGDFYHHDYGDGTFDTGVIDQDTVTWALGWDENEDGLVQVEELEAAAEEVTGDTWDITLERPTVTSEIYDLDNDEVVSVGDTYRHNHNDTEYVESGVIDQGLINWALGWDENEDGLVQVEELEAAANALDEDVWTLTLVPTDVKAVDATAYDQNSDSCVSVGDYYYNFFSDIAMENATGAGKLEQSDLAPILAGYDANHDGKVQISEYQAYYNATTVHTWTASLEPAITYSNKYYYLFIYDQDDNGVCSAGDGYEYWYNNGQDIVPAPGLKGVFTQALVDLLLRDYDANHNGLLEISEMEAAVVGYTNQSCHAELVGSTIDTHPYFPLSDHNDWLLYYALNGHSDWLTNIEIVKDGNGSLAAWMTKNNAGTYWGAGSDLNLKWYMHWYNDYLVASNAAGNYTHYYDWFPDDVRFHMGDGTLQSRWWYDQVAGSPPPYFFMPTSVNVFAGAIQSSQSIPWISYAYDWQNHRYYETGRNSFTDLWPVSFEWAWVKTAFGYEGKALRVMFDEYGVGWGYTHEDWYLVEGIGIVRIDQYADDGQGHRTNCTLSVRTKRFFVNDP